MEQKDYLDELYELREVLRFLLNAEMLNELVELAELIDKSYVDSYHRLKETSTYGKDCRYVAKAKDLFLKLQDNDIADKITKIYRTYIEEKV